MLQDPEKPFEEWEQEVRAQTIDEAKAKCQAIADGQTLTDLLTVTQATVTPCQIPHAQGDVACNSSSAQTK